MNRRIAFVLLLLSLAVISLFGIQNGDVRPSSIPREAVTAPAPVNLAPLPDPMVNDEVTQGTRTRYTLEYELSTSINGGAGPSGRVEGVWVTEQLADGRLAVALEATQVEGHFLLPRPAALRGGAEVQAVDGALAGMGFPHTMDPAARRLYTNIIAATWLTPAFADELDWEAEEHDLVGTYQARYTRDGRVVVRSIDRYLSVNGGTSADATQLAPRGQARFIFDDHGVRTVDVESRLRFTLGDQSTVNSIVRIVLRRVDIDTVALRRGQFNIAGISNHIDSAQEQAVSDDTVLNGADSAELLAEVDRVDALPVGRETRQWRSVTLERLAALVRIDPSEAARIAHAVRDNLDEPGKVSLFLGALGSANTPDGANALAELVGDELPAPVRRLAIDHLNVGDAVTPRSMSALTEALDGENGNSAAAALGSQARLAENAEPDSAEDAIEILIRRLELSTNDQERTAAILALGNSGSARALPYILGAVPADSPRLAKAAVFALRFIPDPVVDETLQLVLDRYDARFETALRAVAWRDPIVWRDRLAAVRGQVEQNEHLVQLIDQILSQFG